MSNTPKRHHYVPQFILRNFANGNQKLYYFRRKDGSVRETSSKNVFVKNHAYTEEQEDGTKSAPVESELAQLEGLASDVIDKIITTARSGDGPMLAEPERRIWLRFLYSQFMRHPAAQKSAREPDYMSVIIDDIERDLGPLSEEMRAYFLEPARKCRMARKATIRAIIYDPEEHSDLMPILESRGIGVVVITNQSESFVIGDKPVLWLPSPATPLTFPECRLLYPISRDIMVHWGPSYVDSTLISLSDHADIRTLNAMAFAQSKAVAGPSKALLQSLACSAAKLSE